MTELKEVDYYCPNCGSCHERTCCAISCEVCGIYEGKDLKTKLWNKKGEMGK